MENTAMPSEVDILSLYFARDEAAIDWSDRCYGRDLMRLSRRILENREDAEENKNDTYLLAWRHIPPTRPLSLPAYLLKVCRNLALDKLDKRKAAKRSAQIVELTAELENCIPTVRSAEETVEARELGRLISAFLRKLPADERYMLMARCFLAEPVPDIAGRLGVNERKVRNTLYRLRGALRRYLEEEWDGR